MRSNALTVCLLLAFPVLLAAQQRNYDPYPMNLNVGRFSFVFNRLNGDGGLQSQFSWNLTGSNPQKSEAFYWPQDQWYSNMLYQIFNPVALDDNGIIDQFGVQQAMYNNSTALTNSGATDWAIETRRYRPPQIVVDGIPLTPPYRWNVNPALPCDIKLEFEDVCGQFGLRSRVEVFAFSHPDHQDYFLWKATQKFTGETKRPRETSLSRDTLPDQTIRFWWPIAFSFGPTKAGERAALSTFAYEGEDDLDSWFKMKSQLVTGRSRDSLYVAYYYDYKAASTGQYKKTDGSTSTDDMGDPDRTTGHLFSTAIPGYALLYADQSASIKTDDRSQPYAIPHATIAGDLWGRRDAGLKATYRGDDDRGRFPLDPITAGFAATPEKGPMRFITIGPYSLTKNRAAQRQDSVTFVLAVGVGGPSWEAADSIGRAWLNGTISDQDKDAFVLQGRDSLAKTMDKAYWAWDRLSRGLPISSPPPPPDIDVASGPDQIVVKWSYPDASYYLDPATGVDDWYAWRVYRKTGAFAVDDPLDKNNRSRWELVYETTSRSTMTYIDKNIQRGVDYYYAVTAVDNGIQNTYSIVPGAKLESSRYENRSLAPATSYKPGMNSSNLVRVVPNPATVAAGGMGFPGTPNKLLFVNLPVKCLLKIYTETGDLVRTIEHYGKGDHEWDQRTDNNQYVSSGIYILTVTGAKDINGQALDNQFVKFVLVR